MLVESLQAGGVTAHILELVSQDIRSDLVELRNRGVERFVVDVGADLLDIFFSQALKSGIVHSKSSFILADLVGSPKIWTADGFPVC